jgi:hypothetical protein
MVAPLHVVHNLLVKDKTPISPLVPYLSEYDTFQQKST